MRAGLEAPPGPQAAERAGAPARRPAWQTPGGIRSVRLGILAGRGAEPAVEFRLRIELDDGRTLRLERTLHPGEERMDGILDILQRGVSWARRSLAGPAAAGGRNLRLGRFDFS